MNRAIFRLLAIAAAFLSSLVAGQQPTEQPAKPAKALPAAMAVERPAKPKLKPEQRQALDILERSEAAARGLEAPMRTYSLLQIASSLPVPDEKRSRALLHDAFTASLEIRDDDDTKSKLQEEIFRALLPLSLDDVQDLLPLAEMKVRKRASEQIIGLYTDKKEFEKAIDLINQVTSWDEFPYQSAGKVMDILPSEMMSEKQGLFLQAVNSYKNHKHSGMMLGDSLTDLIVRHSSSMAPKIVLSAIEDILSQAKREDEDNHGNNITIGGNGGTVSFEGNYQYQLFAFLPILQRLDDSRAKSLLDENQALQTMLQQYPMGLESVMPQPRETPKSASGSQNGAPGKDAPAAGQRMERSILSTDQRNSAMAAQMQAAAQARQQMKQVLDLAETDPRQALAQATNLPVSLGDAPFSPRGGTLTAIAQAALKKNPAVTSQALSELRKIVPDMPLSTQAQSLHSAANLYLDLGDTESAKKVVAEGFQVAEKLLEKDLNPEDPNMSLKAWWPSADAYRRFVEMQTKISEHDTLNLLKEIKDPDIRTVETINYARALLGMPTKRTTIAEKHKSGMNRFMTTTTD
jgi:hypothetical protein